MPDVTKPETAINLRSRGRHLEKSICHNSAADGQDDGHDFANLLPVSGLVMSSRAVFAGGVGVLSPSARNG